MAKILKNNTDKDVSIDDLGGMVVPANGQRDVSTESPASLANSEDLVVLISNQTFTVNDGTSDLSIGDGIDWIRNYQQKFSKTADKKLMALATRRPIGYYTYFSSAGDDHVEMKRGEGDKFMLALDATTSELVRDIHFIDPYIYIRDGYFAFEDAGWGDSISFHVIAQPSVLADSTAGFLSVLGDHRIVYSIPGSKVFTAATYPVPNFTSTGYWNLVNNQLSFCADATGGYDLYDIEHTVFEFANEILVYGTSYTYNYLDSDDAEMLPPGYFMRIIASNVSQTAWKAWGILNTYRQHTI